MNTKNWHWMIRMMPLRIRIISVRCGETSTLREWIAEWRYIQRHGLEG